MRKRKPTIEPPDFANLPPIDPEALWEAKQFALETGPGPLYMHVYLQHAFRRAGYRTTLVARLPTHPIWTVHFAQPLDAICRDRGLLSRRIKAILKRLGMKTQRAPLSLRIEGRYVVLSIISELGEPGEILG